MMTRNSYLILFILFGLLFSFCHKKDPDHQTYKLISHSSINTTSSDPPKPYRIVHVSNSLKEWGLFNIGSYWIYRDSLTAIIDSVYVSSIDTTYTKDSYKSDSDIVNENIHIKVNGNQNDYYNLDARAGAINYIYFPNHYGYCFRLDSTIIYTSPDFENSTIPLFNVLSNTYTNVRHFRFKYSFGIHSSGNYYVAESHFWKKNIGRVKVRHYDIMMGDSYQCKELLRYNVIQ
jgi:hypothetical protein